MCLKRWNLTRFEKGLWFVSTAAILLSFALSGGGNPLTAAVSVLGVTGLLFIAKGYVLGQVLIAVFAAIYGGISFFQQYYGEVITYVGMTMPSAIVTAVIWARHPFQGTREVTVSRLTKGRIAVIAAVTVASTAVFYGLLRACGNADLEVSTLSVATSMIASCLTAFRSPYYALGYASNDVVLIVLWTIAAVRDASMWPMAMCFWVFLFNDIYGFVQWRRMQRRQQTSG